MNLYALADFNLVATHGGFGRAARASGRPKATLSRHVMELEESLGTRLLERGSRSLKLTEAGQNLFARTGGLLKEIAEVGVSISEDVDRPRGRLRVSAPVLLAHVALGRIGAQFALAYPDVRLEIFGEDRFVDPVEEGYDIVIRINPAPDDNLIGRCFLRDELVLIVPPSISRPQCAPGETPLIRAVAATSGVNLPIWIVPNRPVSVSYRPDPILRVSSLLMVRDAVLAGAGAAVLPRFIVAADIDAGRLTCWGHIENRPVEVWALYPSRRLVSSKVTAFLACLDDAFPDRVL